MLEKKMVHTKANSLHEAQTQKKKVMKSWRMVS
jgi:hypothetical protein